MKDQEALIRQLVSETIEVIPYRREWPEEFEREKNWLVTHLPEKMIGRIEHFGSTAIVGLAAKPIIDILVEVTSLQETRAEIVPIMQAAGYQYIWRPTEGYDGPPWYCWFIKRDSGSGKRTHHIHMVEREFSEHWNRLWFRDYLNLYPEVAAEYGQLKIESAACHSGDRVAYSKAKSEWIKRTTAIALEHFGPDLTQADDRRGDKSDSDAQ